MKKHHGYIGQAGTGKTTTLIKDLETYLEGVTWHDHNTLLALTFMHGSRKRLSYKLLHLTKKYKIECQTIDSFATFILQRYRRFVGIGKMITIMQDDNLHPVISEREEDVLVNLMYIRLKATELLKLKVVRDCISNTYPFIVVDEFQDCEDDLLNIIKALAEANILLLAADDFQNLNAKDNNCKATNWLKENTNVVQLEHIWRTSNNQILETAYGLRTNTKIANSILIEPLATYGLAAFRISAQIQWKNWGTKGTNIAIISPVNASVSKFVSQTLTRLKEPFIGKGEKKYRLNPIHLKEENKANEIVEGILELIPDLDQTNLISITNLTDWMNLNHPVIRSAVKSAKRLLQIKGLLYIPNYQFKEILSKHFHLFRTFRMPSKNENFIMTTIHGAKNREFDYVIVLWPYESPGDIISKRKLLYNAITRAKKDAMLIVQTRNGKATALTKDKVFSLFFP